MPLIGPRTKKQTASTSSQSDHKSITLDTTTTTKEGQEDLSVDSNDGGEADSSDSEGNDQFEDDILMSRDYSPVSIQTDQKTVGMYRLVQLAMHEGLRSNVMFENWKEQFITHLYGQFPKDLLGITSRWEDCQLMFAHVEHQKPDARRGTH